MELWGELLVGLVIVLGLFGVLVQVLPGGFGEMCLRPLGGKWILTWFNAPEYRIDAMVLNTPTDNLYTATKTNLARSTVCESLSTRSLTPKSSYLKTADTFLTSI